MPSFSFRTMKVPLSKRLSCVASLIRNGSRVADVGCDHGFLGIHLLVSGKADFVIASDLREKPLSVARQNAVRFGVSERMRFVCADGLKGIAPGDADTIVCAGMGGDAICMILDAAPWLRAKPCTLVLQPQSGVPDLRAYLAKNGFVIDREVPVVDHGFLYSAMRVRYTGICRELLPGDRYLSAAMLRERSPLVRAYWQRMVDSVEKTLQSLKNTQPIPDKQEFFSAALEQLYEMKEELP